MLGLTEMLLVAVVWLGLTEMPLVAVWLGLTEMLLVQGLTNLLFLEAPAKVMGHYLFLQYRQLNLGDFTHARQIFFY